MQLPATGRSSYVECSTQKENVPFFFLKSASAILFHSCYHSNIFFLLNVPYLRVPSYVNVVVPQLGWLLWLYATKSPN